MTFGDARVLDASIIVKCFLIEDGSEMARAAVGGRADWIAPDLLLLEAASVALKACRRGLIDESLATAIVEKTPGLLSEFVPSSELALPALKIAMESGASAYDAAYLALAQARGGRVLTADRKLCDLAARASLGHLAVLLG